MKLIEDIMDMDSIFKDEARFSLDYVPNFLPHRSDTLKTLALLMKEISNQDFGRFHQNIIITGTIGSGKTAISKHFGRMIETINERRGCKCRVIYRHINVRKSKTPYVILTNLIKSLIPYFPRRGYSSPELLNILFETLGKRKTHMILCLDEISNLEARKDELSNFIYSLTRQGSNNWKAGDNQALSLILISRDLSFLTSLDESSRSSLKRNVISLSDYRSAELVDILWQRAEEGLVENAIDKTVISQIALIAEEEASNARYGLELLWKAGKHTDKYQRKRISCEDVRIAASNTIAGYFDRESLLTMDQGEKLLLYAIAQEFSSNINDYSIPLSNIKKTYIRICEEYKIKPREKTQIWKYLNNFKKLGMIQTQIINKGVKGRHSIIKLPDIPSKLLKDEILPLIENPDSW